MLLHLGPRILSFALACLTKQLPAWAETLAGVAGTPAETLPPPGPLRLGADVRGSGGPAVCRLEGSKLYGAWL